MVASLYDLPLEILQDILYISETLSLLDFRFVSKRCRQAVESLPEYATYQEQRIRVESLFQTEYKRKYRWTVASAVRLLGLVRLGFRPPDKFLISIMMNFEAKKYKSIHSLSIK